MNKKEAATFLGISIRTLQRLAQQGRIGVVYKQGKIGTEADYPEEELTRYKEEQSQVVFKPARPEQEALTTTQSEALTPRDERLLRILEALKPDIKSTVVPIESKLTLSLKEASSLAGLSRQHLLDAIKSKKLKGKIIGRGWRVKKEDLESYVHNKL